MASPVVNGILFRPELLLATALFVLLWAHATERPFVAFAAVLLGGLSKETALVLAPAFVVAGVVSGLLPRAPRVLLSEAVALLGAIALRLAFAPAWRSSGPALDGGEAIATRLGALARSTWHLLAPVPPALCDATPVLSLGHPLALAGGAAALAILALGVFRRGPALLLILALLPSFGLVPVPRFWSAHYLYVPLAFVAWLASERVATFPRRLRIAAGVVGIAMAAVSLTQGLRWRDDQTLFGPVFATNPSCLEAAFYVAEARRAAGDLEGAADAYARAATPVPGVLAYADVPGALQNLALVRLQQGKLDAAEAALRRARTYPVDERQRRELTHNEAVIALRRKDWERMELLLREETARPDANKESVVLRARALHELGRFEESRALLQRLGLSAPR